MRFYSPVLLTPLWILFHTLTAEAQFPDYALKVAGKPLKLSIRPSVPNPLPGREINLIVTLLDENGKPSKALQQETILIKVTDPSGRVRDFKEKIDKGKVSEKQAYTTAASGRYLIEAKDQREILYSDKYQFFVPGPTRRSDVLPFRQRFSTFDARPGPGTGGFFLAPQPNAKIYLAVLARDEGILADGKDAALVTATFADDGGKPAPGPIQLLFRRSGGDLQSNPFSIPKDAYEAQAKWTSTSATSATLDLLSTNPPYEVVDKKLNVKFIKGIDGLSPPVGPKSFSFLERPTLTVFFVDHMGNPVATDRKRTVTFTANNSSVQPDKSSVVVEPGNTSATVTLTPVSTGSTTIRVDSGDLRNGTQNYPVTVTNWLLAITCLGGGLAGGVMSLLYKWPRYTGKRLTMAIFSRLLGSIAGGFVLTTLYLFADIPSRVGVAIARNLITTTSISLIGGFGGISILVWALEKLTKQKA